MAVKNKKRLSRRAQERLNRALRAFDLTMLGLVLVAVVCGVICYFRGADLKAGASSGFAYWFLVVTGYLPMLVVNCVRLAFRQPVPAAETAHEVVILTSTVVIWMAGLWIAFRIAGKRDTKSPTLHIATRLAQIVLCWGVFQLGCLAFTVSWNRLIPETMKSASPSVPAAPPAAAPSAAAPDCCSAAPQKK